MHPNAESPIVVAYEVGVMIGDAEIIDAADFAGEVEGGDGVPLTVVGSDKVAEGELAGWRPTSPLHIKRMLRRRPNPPPRDADEHDVGVADENFFDRLELDRRVRIVFIPRRQPVRLDHTNRAKRPACTGAIRFDNPNRCILRR